MVGNLYRQRYLENTKTPDTVEFQGFFVSGGERLGEL
jgi:hypothetical protein